MNDQRLDLSSLDPTRNSARFHALTAAIIRDAVAARARDERTNLSASITSWMRPTLLAAAIVLAIAIPALATMNSSVALPATPVTATEIMGIPRELTRLLQSPDTPTLTQLHNALAPVARR